MPGRGAKGANPRFVVTSFRRPGRPCARSKITSTPSSSACAPAVERGRPICAVAGSILTAAYHVLEDGTVYADLGPDHFRKHNP